MPSYLRHWCRCISLAIFFFVPFMVFPQDRKSDFFFSPHYRASFVFTSRIPKWKAHIICTLFQRVLMRCFCFFSSQKNIASYIIYLHVSTGTEKRNGPPDTHAEASLNVFCKRAFLTLLTKPSFEKVATKGKQCHEKSEATLLDLNWSFVKGRWEQKSTDVRSPCFSLRQ